MNYEKSVDQVGFFSKKKNLLPIGTYERDDYERDDDDSRSK